MTRCCHKLWSLLSLSSSSLLLVSTTTLHPTQKLLSSFFSKSLAVAYVTSFFCFRTCQCRWRWRWCRRRRRQRRRRKWAPPLIRLFRFSAAFSVQKLCFNSSDESQGSSEMFFCSARLTRFFKMLDLEPDFFIKHEKNFQMFSVQFSRKRRQMK